MTIIVRTHGISDSLNNWRNLFNEQTGGRNVILMRSVGSRYRYRPNDWILNWGSSTPLPDQLLRAPATRVINDPGAVGNATNKIHCLNALSIAGVPVVQYTTTRSIAERWFNEGSVVYARTRLQGHSGEGIVVCQRDRVDSEPSLVQSPLYTKGVTGPRREFRIHVFNGVVTNVQLKRRRNGHAENLNYSETVRNFHTGWVYATSQATPNDAALSAALRSVATLGLTFGAVDVITNREQAWVLEVNTAPGMEGSNAQLFVEALNAYVSGRPIQPWNNNNATATPVADEETIAETIATEVRPRNIEVPQQIATGAALSIDGQTGSQIIFDSATNDLGALPEGWVARSEGISLGELNVVGAGRGTSSSILEFANTMVGMGRITVTPPSEPQARPEPAPAPTNSFVEGALYQGTVGTQRDTYLMYKRNGFLAFGFTSRIPVSAVEDIRRVVFAD